MKFLNGAKEIANSFLRMGNMRIETLTAERAEMSRLRKLVERGHFERPIFPILSQFAECDPSRILQQIKSDETRFAAILESSEPNGFNLDNEYYTTPDAEVLYSIVQLYRPQRIVEIGSGHSTHLFRCAIRDTQLATRLVSIDPEPRRDISKWTDEVLRMRAEDASSLDIVERLGENDILFIDSSHSIEIGNDVVWLFLNVIPLLRDGVLIHLHDIFLPYEYPADWVIKNRWKWNEQYLLQTLLQGSNQFDVIWPGHYLQRTMTNFTMCFRNWKKDHWATSVWLRRSR